MKKVLAAALCGAVMFLLPGCGGERLPYAREMGDMALMRTMGVDTGEGGAEQLHVTVSSGRRARGLQGEAEPPLVLSAERESISSACLAMQGLSDSYVFYGHVDQLLLGEELSRRGILETLQYFSQDQELGMGTQVWIVRGGTAAEAISAEQERGVESRLSTIQTDSEMGMAGMTRTVGETLTSLMEDGSAYLPGLVPGEDGALLEAGYGVVKDGMLAGWLTGEQARGLELAAGQVGADILELETRGGGAAVRVTAVSVSCVPEFSGERLTGLELACRLSLRAEESWGGTGAGRAVCGGGGAGSGPDLSGAGAAEGLERGLPGPGQAGGPDGERPLERPPGPVAGGVSGTGDPGDSTGFAAGGLRREKGLKQEKVSFRQLMALLWAGLLGPAAEWLPSMVTERAGPAGWLVPLLALPVLLAAGWLAGSLSRGAGGLSQGLMDSFGPGAGRAVLTIYIIWMELLLALRLRLSAQRMMAAGERDGALWFFLPVLVLMALWISWGKAGRLARTGELFFLLLAAAAAAVVGLALFQVKGENLLPLWTEPAAQTLYAALPVSGVLGYGLYAAFLYTPEEGGREGGRWVRWCAGGCLALCGTQLVILGVFGPALTAELESPFFQMAKSVGVEGAFQRVESLVAAVWSFSDLILLAGLLQGMKRIVGVLLPKASPHAAAVMLLASAGVVGLAAFPNSAIPEALGRGAVLWGNLLLALALPLLAVVVKWFRH